MKNRDEDDIETWRRVARTVKAYKAGAPRAPEKKASAAKAARPVARKPLPAPKNKPAQPVPPAAAGFDAATRRHPHALHVKHAKRGRMEVEARLDLHGLSQDRAFDALCRFVARAAAEGRRNLLVITGKGLRSGGVLRRLLPLWLEGAELRRQVLGFSPARPQDGGDGAFYVRLGKPGGEKC